MSESKNNPLFRNVGEAGFSASDFLFNSARNEIPERDANLIRQLVSRKINETKDQKSYKHIMNKISSDKGYFDFYRVLVREAAKKSIRKDNGGEPLP